MGPNIISIWETLAKEDGCTTGVVFHGFFFIVAKFPASNMTSADVLSSFTAKLENCFFNVSIHRKLTQALIKSLLIEIVDGKDDDGLSTDCIIGVKVGIEDGICTESVDVLLDVTTVASSEDKDETKSNGRDTEGETESYSVDDFFGGVLVVSNHWVKVRWQKPAGTFNFN